MTEYLIAIGRASERPRHQPPIPHQPNPEPDLPEPKPDDGMPLPDEPDEDRRPGRG